MTTDLLLKRASQIVSIVAALFIIYTLWPVARNKHRCHKCGEKK